MRNLGAYAAPDGRLVFDINDFDETIRGPFEWDLKRMAASLVLAGRGSGHKEAAASRKPWRNLSPATPRRSRAFCQDARTGSGRFQVHRLGQVAPDPSRRCCRPSAPRHSTRWSSSPSRTSTTQGPDGPTLERRFKEIKPTLTRVTGRQAAAVLASLGPLSSRCSSRSASICSSLYRPVDVAFKVVGTGSVGLRDYCIYFEGNGPDDPLFLQIKEEPASGYAPYLPDAEPPHHNGQRVAEGQRAMQVQSDPFLGWTHLAGRDYLVRQLNDHKGSIELEDLAGGGLEAYAEVCGELLARGHARSGDPLILAGYIGSGDGFAEALAKFGSAYADQTEKDWNELKRSGKTDKKP